MLILLTGGSACGKSSFAESLCVRFPAPRYYLAAMQPFGPGSAEKIARHRQMRAGKGFETIERYTDYAALRLPQRGTALLECICNLTANEMFCPEGVQAPKAVVKTVVSGIQAVAAAVDQLVIVSNNVFEDGMDYDAGTMAYLHSMGMINEELAQLADKVVEVVVGIPVVWKE